MGTMSGSWPELLGHLVAGNDLSAQDTAWAMDLVMTGEATPARVAAFAVALRAKGETAAEIRGMADAMLAHSVPLEVERRAVDVVGTGGDRSGSVNISTMTAVVLAACGATVVKHGSRAASSKCGTADVLEELGVAIDPATFDAMVAGKSLLRNLYRCHFILREADGVVEDVSLDKLAVLATFQCQCIASVSIHQDELGILFFVEIAILLHELIIILVEVFAQVFGRLMGLCFVVIELLVCLG